MANLYSAVLWRVIDNPTPGVVLTGPVVPTGYAWLIRRLSIWNVNAELPLQGVELGALVEDGAHVMYAQFQDQVGLRGQELYERETRRLLEASRQLYAFDRDGGWSWEVTGWALTTP